MARWRTVIAISILCVSVTNAAAIDGTELARESVDKPKSIDDVCFTPECIHATSWIMTNSKFSVDPCDDFYEFACGNVNLTSIPDDRYTRNEIDLAEDKLLVRLRSLIEGIDKVKVPKHFGLVRTLYDNCMSEGNIDSKEELAAVYDQVYAIGGWPVHLGNKWNAINFGSKSDFLSDLLSISFYVDPERSTSIVPHLAVKERGLHFEILRMGFNNDIVQAYYSLMVDTAVMYGVTRADAEIELKEALLLGIDFARCTKPTAKQMIITERWNRTTVGEFVKKHSMLDSLIFGSIPDSYNLTDDDVVVVAGDFDKFEKVFSTASERVLANWLGWLYLAPHLSILAPQMRAREERFLNFAEGTAEKSSRWKNCVKTVRSELGLSLSALYQRKYMSQNIVSDLAGMVTNMKRQLHQLVTKADWVDTEAKREYHQKIDNMISRVPYRDEYVDDKQLEGFYENVELVEGDLENSLHNISIGTLNATRYSPRGPRVRDDWIVSGNILEKSAMYRHFTNLLYIGASLTLKNIYHIDRPKYMNYGGLGFIMAQGMGHSLDTSGIHIDKQRNVREWWLPETKRKFDDRIQCLVDQYGNYTVEDLGVKLNGLRLAFENTADNIGLKVAYHAYLHWAGQNGEEKELPGLPYTPKQMFWISMGRTWCTKMKKSTLRDWVARETHTPAKQRINGALADSPEFAGDFECKPGTKMNPVRKCSIF